MPSTKGEPIQADRPPKKMRLGTKSCTECRRRKVRCLYSSDSRICRECVLHDTPCMPQTQQSDHLIPESQDDDKGMREKLRELEGIVRVLCKAVDVKVDPSTSGRLEIGGDALKCLRQASIPEPNSGSSSHRASSMDQSELDTPYDGTNSTESFDDAPLLHLFKAAMMIEENAVQGDTIQMGPTIQHQIQPCIKSLNALIPSFEDLTVILQMTEKYWPLWHAFPVEVLPSDISRGDAVANVRNFIFDSMRSSNPVIVAKSALCLAFCMQQLPAHFKHQRPDLPAQPSALVDSYIIGVEMLLPFNTSSTGTLDELECFTLQAKLYINMGKPRNAWLCFRRAMSYAILQGLHTLDGSAEKRHIAIWNNIWQTDRNLSLILGLPSAVADTHPGVGNPLAELSAQEQVMQGFSIIAGHVIDRNQNRQEDDYAATDRIEQELLRYEHGPGSNFLNTTPNPSMPLHVLYELQVTKLFYHNLRKLTHLPYMLKSSSDRQYEHNRLAALGAAREMITAWQQLRDCSGAETLIICDLMDFEVFTAAIVLVLNLLSESCPDPVHQQASDWGRVHDITLNLQHISREMECNVAGQAATLLEYLSAVHQGTYDGPEIYQAVIPYFGKVRISQVRKATPSPVDMKLGAWDEQDMLSNMVEFSADTFVPFSQGDMGKYLTEAELGVDWTAVLNADIGYEWSQSFHSSGFGLS